MRLGKRERAMERAIKVRNDAVVSHNMRQPKPTATSGDLRCRIQSDRLMAATHHMGFLEAGRGKSRDKYEPKTSKRYALDSYTPQRVEELLK